MGRSHASRSTRRTACTARPAISRTRRRTSPGCRPRVAAGRITRGCSGRGRAVAELRGTHGRDKPMETDRGTLKVAVASVLEQPVVARLMQLYLHDFSEFAQLDPSHGDVDDDGLFPYPWLDLYWTEKKREPFLFRVDGRLAGFALIGGWSASGR